MRIIVRKEIKNFILRKSTYLFIFVSVFSIGLSNTVMTSEKALPYETCEHIKQKTGNLYTVECSFQDAVTEGIKIYYPSGSLESEYQLKNGKRDGDFISYYEPDFGKEPQIKSKSSFKDGKQDGSQTNYYENGKLLLVMRYKEGQLHGETTYFGRDGKKTHSYYKNGWLDGRQKSPYGSGYDRCFSDGDQLVMSVFGCRKTSRVIKTRLELAQEQCAKYEICSDLERLNKSTNSRLEKTSKANDKPDKQLMRDSLAPLKLECEEIGYKKGTEKFGDCVLKLLDKR